MSLKKSDYENDNGMLTTVWGPSLWHSIHTITFNYPVRPTKQEQDDYYKFIMSLEKVLPCKYCRENFSKNMRAVNKRKRTTLKRALARGRAGFSRYMYDFHNEVNVMLGKPITLTYKQVKERYENFRARCSKKDIKKRLNKTRKNKKEKGCVDPLYGKKTKCIIRIIPKEVKTPTLKIDKKCKKFN